MIGIDILDGKHFDPERIWKVLGYPPTVRPVLCIGLRGTGEKMGDDRKIMEI